MDAKSQSLRQHGTLHPHPYQVSDPLFLNSSFFDPRDLVLVKYEMLRRVRVEKISVSRATAAFALSRPVYYAALNSFENHGLLGLLPQRSGPRHASKMSPAIVEFLYQHHAQDPPPRAIELAALIQERFGVVVHPRTITRVLGAGQKKGR